MSYIVAPKVLDAHCAQWVQLTERTLHHGTKPSKFDMTLPIECSEGFNGLLPPHAIVNGLLIRGYYQLWPENASGPPPRKPRIQVGTETAATYASGGALYLLNQAILFSCSV